jgi:hypothetical protein
MWKSMPSTFMLFWVVRDVILGYSIGNASVDGAFFLRTGMWCGTSDGKYRCLRAYIPSLVVLPRLHERSFRLRLTMAFAVKELVRLAS